MSFYIYVRDCTTHKKCYELIKSLSEADEWASRLRARHRTKNVMPHAWTWSHLISRRKMKIGNANNSVLFFYFIVQSHLHIVKNIWKKNVDFYATRFAMCVIFPTCTNTLQIQFSFYSVLFHSRDAFFPSKNEPK